MSSSPSAAARLSAVVRLHEGIKGVVLIAFRINLMALNAMLLARRAGELALGFGVISKELRALSAELARQMRQLQQDARDAVRLISSLLGLERRCRLLGAAQAAAAQPGLAAVLARRLQERDQLLQSVAEARLRLLANLEETRNLCLFGAALSRSARIEAAYGQGCQAALTEVSLEFAEKTEQILPCIEALRLEMNER
nr:hypothetical protein [Chromobacterium sp. ASV5]